LIRLLSLPYIGIFVSMKSAAFLLFLSAAAAFAPQRRTQSFISSKNMGYVPDGMSPEEYRKLRQKEQDKVKNKRFGAFGPQTFKSRSMQAFQKDLEEGKGGHLMPVFNAKEKLKSGKIKKEDIPYMQRLGAWDNSDVQNAKKKQWRGSDKKYNQNADQGGIGWSGNTPVRGPQSISKSEQKTPKKKFFGLF
jgi:hypothetical protein